MSWVHTAQSVQQLSLLTATQSLKRDVIHDVTAHPWYPHHVVTPCNASILWLATSRVHTAWNVELLYVYIQKPQRWCSTWCHLESTTQGGKRVVGSLLASPLPTRGILVLRLAITPKITWRIHIVENGLAKNSLFFLQPICLIAIFFIKFNKWKKRRPVTFKRIEKLTFNCTRTWTWDRRLFIPALFHISYPALRWWPSEFMEYLIAVIWFV